MNTLREALKRIRQKVAEANYPEDCDMNGIDAIASEALAKKEDEGKDNHEHEIDYWTKRALAAEEMNGKDLIKQVLDKLDTGKAYKGGEDWETFDQCLREEFLVNTQNYPQEYKKLFQDKYERAEKRFKSQSVPPYKEEEVCEYCGGKGWFINEDHKDFPNTQQKVDCYHCKKELVPEGYYIHYGSGKYWEDEPVLRKKHPYKEEVDKDLWIFESKEELADYIFDICKKGASPSDIIQVLNDFEHYYLESKEEAEEE